MFAEPLHKGAGVRQSYFVVSTIEYLKPLDGRGINTNDSHELSCLGCPIGNERQRTPAGHCNGL